MGRIINYEDITIRDVTANLDAEEFDPYIIEAEEIDIKQILGNRLFTDMVANQASSDPDYATLLAGGSYTYGDYTYEFKGLKYALQYYAWARYLENPYIHTSTGLTNHNDEFGTKPSQGELRKMADDVRSTAWAIMKDVIEYLNNNSTGFPLWDCSSKRNKSGSVKISIN